MKGVFLLMKYHPGRLCVKGLCGIPVILFFSLACLALLSWSGTETFAAGEGAAKSQKATEKKKTPVKPRAAKAQKPANSIQAKAAYCVDLHEKKPIVSRNADKRLPVASLTKLVTALVVLDRMPGQRMVTVPEHIKKIPKSVVGLKPGDRVAVRDLLHGLLISSGNDCAETLACAYPGGRKAFISAMNLKARSLGAKHTVFYNPSGLDIRVPGSGKDEKSEHVRSNVSTAREMAIIARTAFSNKTIKQICAKKSYVMHSSLNGRGYRIRTTNRLLKDNLPVVGGKTGYTARAGHCLASAFTPGGRVFLIVVLGSPDHFHDTRLIYRKALRDTEKSRDAARQRTKQPRVALYPGH